MSGSLTAGGFGSCNPLDEGEGRDKEPERDHDPDNHYKPVEQPRPADRLVALGTRVAEAVGVRRLQCACESDCWCKTSGLSLFRWLVPGRFHRLRPAAHE